MILGHPIETDDAVVGVTRLTSEHSVNTLCCGRGFTIAAEVIEIADVSDDNVVHAPKLMVVKREDGDSEDDERPLAVLKFRAPPISIIPG